MTTHFIVTKTLCRWLDIRSLYDGQVFIMEMIPDIPEAIQIQLQRQQFIIKKIIDREPDQQQLGPDSLSNPISQQKYSSTTQNTAAKSEQQRSIAVQQYPF